MITKFKYIYVYGNWNSKHERVNQNWYKGIWWNSFFVGVECPYQTLSDTLWNSSITIVLSNLKSNDSKRTMVNMHLNVVTTICKFFYFREFKRNRMSSNDIVYGIISFIIETSRSLAYWINIIYGLWSTFVQHKHLITYASKRYDHWSQILPILNNNIHGE